MRLNFGGRLGRFLPLVFALIMGGVAVFLARQWVSQVRAEYQRRWKEATAHLSNPIEVIVAKADVPEGTALNVALLTTAKIPEQFVQPYAVRSPAELVGKVTLVPISGGEQILSNKVRRPEDFPAAATLSGLMDEGARAVTIAVDSLTGVGGFIRPGDLVDVLWTVQLAQAQGQKESVTWTLFQSVPVLAVAREMLGKSSKPAEESQQYTVTVSMSPQNSLFLLYAREQGKIQLSLRRAKDKETVAIVPASTSTLMERVLNIPPPQPPPMHQVEVYKGLEREQVAFSEPQQ